MNNEVFDVIVIGGGVAGVSAALSASREKRKVLLIEKNSMLGGLATAGLINWFEPLCDGKGTQLIFSECEELFNLALKYGYKSFDEDWQKKGLRKSSWFDHNLFALSMNQLLIDNGVTIYYDTLVSDVKVEKDLIKSIEISTVEGKHNLFAKQFIDASGSAFLFRQAGLPVREGINYLVYATTTYKKGVGKPTAQYSGTSYSGKNNPMPDKTFNGYKQEDVNEFVKDAQLYCLKQYEEGKITDVSMLPSMPQFRKIASIVGEYCLTKEDLFKHHEDSIGAIGMFCKPGDIYEVPLGCLYTKKINNLYACGRIVSSDDEGWEATRVIPVCILTGEVAGLFASMSIDKRPSVQEIQKRLVDRGIKLHF